VVRSRRLTSFRRQCRFPATSIDVWLKAANPVGSRTLATAPWERSSIARGDLVAEIATLKDQPGGDIIAHGGAGFAHSLLSAGVIDEYRLVINPVLLGQGLSIFGNFPRPRDLHLSRAQAFATGAVLHIYDRASRVSAN
jgi:dihydrofolate reductase